MISSENITHLNQNEINYIVGARLGNLSIQLLGTIDEQIVRQDGKSIRIKTELGYLICSYSSVRYRKDLYEMNKQIEKAKVVVEVPSKSRKLNLRRSMIKNWNLTKSLSKKLKSYSASKATTQA